MNNTAGAAASITATGGTPQSAAINTAFGTVLTATVKDSGSNPVSGVVVTFAAPAFGRERNVRGGRHHGERPMHQAWRLRESSRRMQPRAAYTGNGLREWRRNAGQLHVDQYGGNGGQHHGDGRHTAERADQHGIRHGADGHCEGSGSNPVSGVTVMFTAPGAARAGRSRAGVTPRRTTNASGVAASGVFTANATVGSYTRTASVNGVVTTGQLHDEQHGGTPRPA